MGPIRFCAHADPIVLLLWGWIRNHACNSPAASFRCEVAPSSPGPPPNHCSPWPCSNSCLSRVGRYDQRGYLPNGRVVPSGCFEEYNLVYVFGSTFNWNGHVCTKDNAEGCRVPSYRGRLTLRRHRCFESGSACAQQPLILIR